MKNFRGRAILADEVGLGKTIEAGLILKEYMMRGLVRSALILAPSSLVHQWQGELRDKFDIPFVSTNDPLFKQDPDRFWEEPFILASIQTAKTKRHFDTVTSRTYDIVIVDEAHHVKNRTTLNWKLVNAIQKTFLLMLTATPVQNSLEELYNLVTLLRPGHLKTQKAFKEEFVTRGNPTDPRNREKLRQLLKEVMVRNTRSVTQLHLPPRFATTVRISPSPAEEEFYQAISSFVGEQASKESSGPSKLALRKLLEAAGSSHYAALRMLERMAQQKGKASDRAAELLTLGKLIPMGAKATKVMELLKASPDQKIIFVNYTATLEHLEQILKDHKIPHVVFHGSLTTAQKAEAIETFRKGRKVLLATGTGGEGHNLQFCHMMLNYDLPWNPMEIEQRIGRIHRIGQEKEVQVYNFCASGSIEDHILEVLDRKINMFELVVGEIDMILGRLQGEEEFSDLVYEIWVKHPDEAERKKAFDALAAKLKRARSAYQKSKELDEKLFQEDFGI
jgi:SNF2 family DNA or RNA helicase